MNKLQRSFNYNTNHFIHANASENIVCDTAAILSRGRWVNANLSVISVMAVGLWWYIDLLEALLLTLKNIYLHRSKHNYQGIRTSVQYRSPALGLNCDVDTVSCDMYWFIYSLPYVWVHSLAKGGVGGGRYCSKHWMSSHRKVYV